MADDLARYQWKVHGPVTGHTLNIATGETSEPRDLGYGYRCVHPAMFGGREIVAHGLTLSDAQAAVDTHNAQFRCFCDGCGRGFSGNNGCSRHVQASPDCKRAIERLRQREIEEHNRRAAEIRAEREAGHPS